MPHSQLAVGEGGCSPSRCLARSHIARDSCIAHGDSLLVLGQLLHGGWTVHRQTLALQKQLFSLAARPIGLHVGRKSSRHVAHHHTTHPHDVAAEDEVKGRLSKDVESVVE